MNLHPPRPARQRTTLHASSLTNVVVLATLCMASLAPVANSAQAQTYQEVREQRRDAQRVQAPDFGQREFNANCAACHGMDAKGRGPVAGFLTKNPPDLTTVAKRNGGVFPMDRLYRVVDGTELPEGAQAGGPHGSREMPIWGRDYRVRDAEYFGDTPYNPDGMVRGRILALLEYLNRLQVK
jgi:mono/diheme cytochrome c family protein